MEIVKERQGGVTLLRLAGRLDHHWSQALDEALNDAAREGVRHVRLDFSGVTYISSAAAAILEKHQREAAELQGSLQISAASERARNTLRQMGFVELLIAGAGGRAMQRRTLSIPLPLDSERATYESRLLEGKASEGFIVGNANLDGASSSAVSIYRDVYALGVGAFGATHAECRDSFGEFLAAAGGAATMPADGTATPDYMVSSVGLAPSVQALYAIGFRGSPSHQLRFEANGPGAVPLSDIARACASLAGTPTAGVVMAAEIDGLVCARLRRSPAQGPVQFDFPAVREWFSFTPEREFARFSALVVGIVSSAPSPALAPFLRPLSETQQGHFHAMVTAFRSLPRGKLPVAPVVAASLQPRNVLSVVHLLSDRRPIEGTGESEFQRGVCWVFPIGEGGMA